MTKHYKEITLPPKTTKRLERITCDICSQEIKRKNCWDVMETEVRYKTGNSYPQGGSGEETTWDICQQCFTDKIIPWLESQGAIGTTKDWDW